MAEPFGLFQFLQSFLGQNPPASPETQERSANENLQTIQETLTPAATENNVETHAESVAETAPNTSNRQAIVQFMQTHEQRAKRIKKPYSSAS